MDKIKLIKTDALHPYAMNARTHSAAQIDKIAASIREFGFTNPILARMDGTVIAGHARLEAAKKLELAEVPVIFLDRLTPDQARAYVLADNKLALDAGWDDEILSDELAALNDAGFDLSLIGFSEVELDALLPGAETLSEDDAPVEFDETVPAVSQLGDVWRLGKHRLICADNGDQNAISALFGDARAYLLFTSPPYANQRDYKNPITDWTAMMDRMIVAAEQSALTDDTQILVNLGMIFRENEWEPYWREWEASMRCEGFRRFALYIWDKMMAVPGDYKGRLAQRHEFIFHFNKRSRQANKIVPCKYAGLKKEFNYCFRGKDGVLKPSGESTTGEYRIPDSVIQVLPQLGQIGDGIDHPAVFSVDLPRFVMETYTDKGEIVYEPFCGSGTSIIAGERCGRIVYAAEIAPEYVDVALKRWTQNYPGEPPTLEKTGQTFEEVEEERLSNLKS